MRIHNFIAIMLAGLVMVDLCFDSLLLKNTDEGLLGIQAYYAHVRSSPLVPVVTAVNGLATVALVLSLIFRRSKRDLFALAGNLVIMPYFMIVMEPIEDACMAAKGLLLPSAQHWRHNFQLVAAGHLGIFLFLIVAGLWEVDWSLRAPRRVAPQAKKTT